MTINSFLSHYLQSGKGQLPSKNFMLGLSSGPDWCFAVTAYCGVTFAQMTSVRMTSVT